MSKPAHTLKHLFFLFSKVLVLDLVQGYPRLTYTNPLREVVREVILKHYDRAGNTEALTGRAID